MGSLYPIQTVTVGSGGQASIAFNSIPTNYTHLLLRVSGQSERTTGTADDMVIQFNSSTSGYSDRMLYASGGTAATISDINSGNKFDSAVLAQFNSTFSITEFFIPNYRNSQNKLIMSESAAPSNTTTQYIYLSNGTLSNTAAIDSITLTTWSGNDFAQYTKATLYGLRDN